jgi:hypothetical protein
MVTRQVRIEVEQLETRLAPATLVNHNTVTYRDVDGDSVTVSISKPGRGHSVDG